MTEQDFRLERHKKIWEEQNKLVKRLIFIGLLFGFVLPWKFLDPFSDASSQTSKIRNDILQLDKERVQVAAQKQSMDQVNSVLNDVQKTISREPWMNETDKFRQALAQISRQGGDRKKAYQKAADEKVIKIGHEVRQTVVKPLKDALNQVPESSAASTAISDNLSALESEIDIWEQNHLGQVWYGTFPEKQANVRQLTNSLNAKIRPLASSIRDGKHELDGKRKELSEHAKVLANSREEKDGKLAQLDLKMQTIFPSWLQGIVTIEQMIQLYPLLVVCLIIYLGFIAHAISKHHAFVAHSLGFSGGESSDPATSSHLTLTTKGFFSTTLTLAIYFLFFVAMWIFFEWGCALLGSWLNTNGPISWFLTAGGIKAVQWIGRTAFLIIAILTVMQPFQYKTRMISQTA